MDWQQATALTLVFLTAAFMAWRRFRPRRFRGRGAGCGGCGAGAATGLRETVVLHARKGGRAQVIVRPAPGRDAAP